MRSRFYCNFWLWLVVLVLGAPRAWPQDAATVWLTKPDRSALIAAQPAKLPFNPVAGHSQEGGTVLSIDGSRALQSVDGFGLALTGGSAQLMMRMDAAHRQALIRELFQTDGQSIGLSYLRVSIGSSDMNAQVFTYDDMPAGKDDPKLEAFSLGPDRQDVIPVLKEILAVNPKIRILASPWSAPAWMKTNGAMKGGSLKPEDYGVYAEYLVKYIQAMRAEGIRIDAMTMQNEPLNPKNTPSMMMEAGEQATFLKQALGPLLGKGRLRVKVILYDHNCDRPDYPLSILADPEAARYADGSGFHLYAGQIDALTKVHDAYPQKNVYFTEQMVIDKPGATRLEIAAPERRVVIGALENWSRAVLLWNLAADAQNGPHTDDGGCPVCEGAVTIEGNTVTRNLAYYTIAQVSKFVSPGSVRLASSIAGPASLRDDLAQVVFRTPAGRYALLVVNASATTQDFSIRFQGRSAAASLSAGSAATYTW